MVVKLAASAGEMRTAGDPLAPARADLIGSAAIEALAYADVFDWPLTSLEIHCSLPILARREDVEAVLVSPRLGGTVSSAAGLHVLAGRETLIDRRRRREAASARLWPRAVRSCRILAALPWVRMVAVSGSLAVGAAHGDDDLDLFIVTADGRVWLARVLTIAVGKAADRMTRRRDVWLCPNYVLARSMLALPERDMFTAHELAQMVPLYGPDAYRDLLDANRWYRDFLPNHPGYTGAIAELPLQRTRRAAEGLLRNRWVSRLERWEMDRKISRLGPGLASAEVRFDATVCKGHVDEYRRRTLTRLQATMSRLGATAR